ncbi:LuxR family DNA-binding response regulator [Pseudomonas amygdali pv. morsprunorum]|uniref:LuxR family DNA-binding response regulator n=7 Tax=Pseudomonas syringae group TaxID=136849 RepID=A0A3M2WDF6_PSEA0|nr:LuxR family DNA-binding response regulator [Pseudomonas amygdali pv. morsprunorum]
MARGRRYRFRGARQWHRRAGGQHRPAVRCLLHHQARGDGDWSGDQPVDHRGPRRTHLGHAQPVDRCYVSLHAAHRKNGNLMTTLAAASQAEEPIIYVIDDDLSVRSSLEDLLASVGLRSLLFGSTKEFMEASRPDAPGCLILDIRMPGMSGLDFQEHMAKSGIFLPVIFITGHGDIPMSVRAMKAGAIEFLTKPFREQDLLDAIQQGLAQDRSRRQSAAIEARLQRRHASLNQGEQQVMALVVSGLLNKQIAAQLNVSEITVKVRRGSVMRKMEADSLADLVKFAERLKELH